VAIIADSSLCKKIQLSLIISFSLLKKFFALFACTSCRLSIFFPFLVCTATSCSCIMIGVEITFIIVNLIHFIQKKKIRQTRKLVRNNYRKQLILMGLNCPYFDLKFVLVWYLLCLNLTYNVLILT
jgi:type III secretory pathway component EscU